LHFITLCRRFFRSNPLFSCFNPPLARSLSEENHSPFQVSPQSLHRSLTPSRLRILLDHQTKSYLLLFLFLIALFFVSFCGPSTPVLFCPRAAASLMFFKTLPFKLKLFGDHRVFFHHGGFHSVCFEFSPFAAWIVPMTPGLFIPTPSLLAEPGPPSDIIFPE